MVSWGVVAGWVAIDVGAAEVTGTAEVTGAAVSSFPASVSVSSASFPGAEPGEEPAPEQVKREGPSGVSVRGAILECRGDFALPGIV